MRLYVKNDDGFCLLGKSVGCEPSGSRSCQRPAGGQATRWDDTRGRPSGPAPARRPQALRRTLKPTAATAVKCHNPRPATGLGKRLGNRPLACEPLTDDAGPAPRATPGVGHVRGRGVQHGPPDEPEAWRGLRVGVRPGGLDTLTSQDQVAVTLKQPDYWRESELSSAAGIITEKSFAEKQGKNYGTRPGRSCAPGRTCSSYGPPAPMWSRSAIRITGIPRFTR